MRKSARATWVAAFVVGCLVVGVGSAQADQWVVTSVDDSGGGTLREALVTPQTDPGDSARTISFSLGGATRIELSSGVNVSLSISQLTINGSLGGADKVTIASTNATTPSASGVTQTIAAGNSITLTDTNLDTVRIQASDSASVTNSSITGASNGSYSGGAISSGGTVTITGSTISNNQASGAGGAISATGNVTVTGSTITNNSANGGPTDGDGGAISSGGTVTITNSNVTLNTAARNGGAISSAGDVRLVDSNIDTNFAYGNGGGVIVSGSISTDNSSVSDNIARGSGGAIQASGTYVEIYGGSDISGNMATTAGGAIAANGTSTEVQILGNAGDPSMNTRVNGNRVTNGPGGAIMSNGQVLIEGSTVSENSSTGSGGAILADANVTLSSATLSGNTSDANGGAIYSYQNVNISDSTLTHNTAAANGGAIDAKTMVSTFANSYNVNTFSNNTAGGSGGAIYAEGNSNGGSGTAVKGNVTLGTVELSNNTAGNSGGGIYAAGTVTLNGDLTATSNSAAGGSGGAIATQTFAFGTTTLGTPSNVLVTGSVTATANTALNAGGAISANGLIEIGSGNSSISNFINNAASSGGALSSTMIQGTLIDASGGVTSFTPTAIAGSSGITLNTNSAFKTNSATAGNGGAIYADEDVTLGVDANKITYFYSNSATGNGGAIYIAPRKELIAFTCPAEPWIPCTNTGTTYSTESRVVSARNGVNPLFYINSAGVSGGGIYGGGADIDQGSFIGNQASSYGGAIFLDQSTLANISNSYFTGNTSGIAGGAIYVQNSATGILGSVPLIINSTFQENQSVGFGAAIYDELGINLINDTFVDNKITGTNNSSTGLTLYYAGSAPMNVANTLFLGDTGAVINTAVCQFTDTTNITFTQMMVGDVNPGGECAALEKALTYAIGDGLIDIKLAPESPQGVQRTSWGSYSLDKIAVQDLIDLFNQIKLRCASSICDSEISTRQLAQLSQDQSGFDRRSGTGLADLGAYEFAYQPVLAVIPCANGSLESENIVANCSSFTVTIDNYDADFPLTLTVDQIGATVVQDATDPAKYIVSGLSSRGYVRLSAQVGTPLSKVSDADFAAFAGELTTRRVFVIPHVATTPGSSDIDVSDLTELINRAKANLALETKLIELAKQGSENLVSLLTTMEESFAPQDLAQLHEVIASDKELSALTEDGWLEKLNIDNPLVLFAAAADTTDGAIGQLLISSMAKDFDATAFAQFKELISGSNNADFLAIFEKTFGISFEEWLKSNAIPDLLKALTPTK